MRVAPEMAGDKTGCAPLSHLMCHPGHFRGRTAGGSIGPMEPLTDLQAALLRLAKDKTEQLYLASFPTALPDIRKGIGVRAS